MSPVAIAVALSLSTAVLHAGWNVFLKTSGDPLRLSARALASATIILSPAGAALWLLSGRPGITPTTWVLAVISSFVELGYFVFLSRAYRGGDISTVYPLARGTAALLAVGTGTVLLGERPSGFQLLGVMLLLSGILMVQRPALDRSSILPALVTGVCISAYTAIDKVGIGGTRPWLYGWLLWIFTATLLTGWVYFGGRDDSEPHEQSAGSLNDDAVAWKTAIPVGLMITTNYLLVLIALSLAPLTVVGPARESAVVLVALWGVWRLRERSRSAWRLIGAAGIMAGIVVLVMR